MAFFMQGVRFRTDFLYMMYGRLRELWHCWRPATFQNSCWRNQCPCARLKHGDWVDLLHSYQYVHAGLLQSLGGAGATVGWRARFVSGSTAATATSRHSIDDGEYLLRFQRAWLATGAFQLSARASFTSRFEASHVHRLPSPLSQATRPLPPEATPGSYHTIWAPLRQLPLLPV